MATLTTGEPSRKYALSGVARSGATRFGHVSKKVFVKINGTQRAYNRPSAASRVFVESLKITEANGSTPNRAAMRTMGFAVSRLQEIIITVGSVNRLRREFGGVILSTTERRLVDPANVVYDLGCVDYGWELNALVTGHYTGTADEIAIQLIQTFAPMFSTAKIQPNLPTVDGGISYTNVRLRVALDRLADRVGATWRPDYRRRILFGTEAYAWRTNPRPVSTASPTFIFDDNFSIQRDESQRITRAHCEGGGGEALAEISAGETIIPVSAAPASWYGDTGGEVIIGDSQQIVRYGARVEGGGGGLVGPGAQPTAPLSMAQALGGTLPAGMYKGWYTFVTGSGQSLVSPAASVTLVGTVPAPSTSLGLTSHDYSGIGAALTAGDYQYAFSWTYPGGYETLPSTPQTVAVGAGHGVVITGLVNGPYGATGKKVWRTVSGGSQLKLLTTLATDDSYIDLLADAALGANAPVSATAIFGSITYTNIPAGQSGVVTSRKVYRSVIGGSDPLLLTTLADNSTHEYGPNSTADGSLGAAAPVTDTSGLSQPAGQVAAGSTSVPVAGGEWPDSGWAITPTGAVFRYTTRSASALTGVPPTGPGSLGAPLGYNTPISIAPQLTGISSGSPGNGSITNTIPKGAAVNLWVTVDDLIAQGEIAALLDPYNETNGAAGIIADVVSDERITRDEAIARATALLNSQSDEFVTIQATSTDLNARASTDFTWDDGSSPTTLETLKVQDVEISWIDAEPPVAPFRNVTASSKRFTLEDLIRRAREN